MDAITLKARENGPVSGSASMDGRLSALSPLQLGTDRSEPCRPVVLILTLAFPPDPHSGAARPGRFAKYLARFGYEPVVICQTTPGRTAGSAAVRRVPLPAPRRVARALAGLGRLAQRLLLPYDDGLPWAAHALVEAEAVLARRPIAAVLSTSPPAGSHLVALELKLRHGLPWVADFRDPLRGNPFRLRRWLFPYDRLLEGLLFRHADALIANTDTTADLWRRHHPGIDGKVSVIWNGFDPEDRFDPTPIDPGDRRVLAHVGALYGRRHPGRLLASLLRLILTGELAADRVCVRLVGPIDGGCFEANREVVDALRSRGCLEYDGRQVSRDEARRAGLRADYLLLLDLNEQEVDLQVPAKIFEYVRIGRPILAFTRRDSPVERILQGSGVPCRVVHHGASNAAVDDAVRGVFDLPTSSTRPSPWFEEQFDGRNQTRALAGILDRVRGGSPIPEASIND